MRKRLSLLSLSMGSLLLSSSALAGYVEIAKVSMPELTSSEWALLRQQQGSNPQIVSMDVNLAVDRGVVYAVTIRHGSGYPEIDNTIVNWIASNWRTDNWFRGGEGYVVSLDLDPVLRHVVFRGNDGTLRATDSSFHPLNPNLSQHDPSPPP